MTERKGLMNKMDINSGRLSVYLTQQGALAEPNLLAKFSHSLQSILSTALFTSCCP